MLAQDYILAILSTTAEPMGRANLLQQVATLGGPANTPTLNALRELVDSGQVKETETKFLGAPYYEYENVIDADASYDVSVTDQHTGRTVRHTQIKGERLQDAIKNDGLKIYKDGRSKIISYKKVKTITAAMVTGNGRYSCD